MVESLYKLDLWEKYDLALLVDFKTWHKHLAHVDTTVIKSMKINNVTTGIDFRCTSDKDELRRDCIHGKGHRKPIPNHGKRRTQSVLELVHSDVCGPLEEKSLTGSKHFVSFVDDFSRWTIVCTMKLKSDVLDCFKQYYKLTETQSGNRIVRLHFQNSDDVSSIKSIRSDNGGEYISNDFKEYLREHGIENKPQQNGGSERLNRTLINLVRSILYESNIGKQFWG